MEEPSAETNEPSVIRESLESYVGGKPRAIYLISPGVAKGVNVDFKSATMLGEDYLRGTIHGYNGGILRIWAVADLYKFFPDTEVITSSISPANKDTELSAPISHAQVQERELRRVWKKRGVKAPESIIKEENSISTITELAELVKLIVQNGWCGNIVGVTNDYHVERTTKMLERLPSLLDVSKPEYTLYKDFGKTWREFKRKEENGEVSIEIKGAESILSLTDPKFKHALRSAFSQEPWKSSLELRELWEEKGIEALESQNYESQPLKTT